MTWDGADPFLYICRTSVLDRMNVPLREALAGRMSSSPPPSTFTLELAAWPDPLRPARPLSTDANPSSNSAAARRPSARHSRTAEVPRGRDRDRCRCRGVARKRIDDVYRGDVREIVAILDEKFDWIIGGDIVEHLDEPWSFLTGCDGWPRRRSSAAQHPQPLQRAVVADLLHGRFDYVYMGSPASATCASSRSNRSPTCSPSPDGKWSRSRAGPRRHLLARRAADRPDAAATTTRGRPLPTGYYVPPATHDIVYLNEGTEHSGGTRVVLAHAMRSSHADIACASSPRDCR